MLLEIDVLWLGVREAVEEQDGGHNRQLEGQGDEGDLVRVVMDQVTAYDGPETGGKVQLDFVRFVRFYECNLPPEGGDET